jgi:hypothetical protein
MEEVNVSEEPRAERPIERLNRWLLWLLATEFGYVSLLVVGGGLLWVSSFVSTNEGGNLWALSDDFLLVGVVVPLTIAFIVNLAGLMGTLVLHLLDREVAKGPVGVGHLLNGVYVTSVGWIFILALISMTFSMSGFD